MWCLRQIINFQMINLAEIILIFYFGVQETFIIIIIIIYVKITIFVKMMIHFFQHSCCNVWFQLNKSMNFVKSKSYYI